MELNSVIAVPSEAFVFLFETLQKHNTEPKDKFTIYPLLFYSCLGD